MDCNKKRRLNELLFHSDSDSSGDDYDRSCSLFETSESHSVNTYSEFVRGVPTTSTFREDHWHIEEQIADPDSDVDPDFMEDG